MLMIFCNWGRKGRGGGFGEQGGKEGVAGGKRGGRY